MLEVFDLSFIKKLRESLRLSKLAWSAKAKIHRAQWSRVERGQLRLTLFNLGRVAKLLKVSTALCVFACLKVPEELDVAEAETFTVLRSIMRGKLLASFDGKKFEKFDILDLEGVYVKRGWTLPDPKIWEEI